LTNWLSGRYVLADDVNKVHGTIMAGVGMETEEVPDGGPLFPAKRFFKILKQSWLTPQYFDEITDWKIKKVRSTRTYAKVYFPKAAGEFLWGGGEAGKIEFRLVEKDRRYIVSKLYELDGEGKEVVDSYSYYFKNVTPKP